MKKKALPSEKEPVLHAARAFFRGCRFCFLTARAWPDDGEAAGWEALSPRSLLVPDGGLDRGRSGTNRIG